MTNLSKIPIAVAEGDGIGPEIMKATLRIIESAKCPLDLKPIEIGEKVYLRGHKTGIEPESWNILRKTRAFLKAPISTPQGGGFKSLNVTVRAALGLYANIRPCCSFAPFIATKHPSMDLVIIRENEEDLYCGIEYKATEDIAYALKIISRHGSEKIIRYAFEYAKKSGRKKVTAFTKDNILKMSDGLFHAVFDEIGALYPEVEKEHWIVDIGAAKMADTPENFDIIVLPNLYGDILSDVAAQIAGSVGLAGSANIGSSGAMFEAIHGSAPRRAGQNIANPSGLIQASVLMLEYLGLGEKAALIQNSLLATLEEGTVTYDLFREGQSKKKLSTSEFADAIIHNLGKEPKVLKKAKSIDITPSSFPQSSPKPKETKRLVGLDLYIEFHDSPKKLLDLIQKKTLTIPLSAIFNRGMQIWPSAFEDMVTIPSYRLRFLKDHETVSKEQFHTLIQELSFLEIGQIESLFFYNDKPGFSGYTPP